MNFDRLKTPNPDESPSNSESQLQPDEQFSEGTVYVYRNGQLQALPRDTTEGIRKVRITEEAYQVAMEISDRLRSSLLGWRPDVTLVISAILTELSTMQFDSEKAVTNFMKKMVS